MRFDYVTAWERLAFPAYQKLPERVRRAHATLAPIAATCSQDRNCDLTWPEDIGQLNVVTATLTVLSTEDLAHGACVIHDCGHWLPGNKEQFQNILQEDIYRGSYWRTVLWFSQTIGMRLALGKRGQHNGHGYHIQDGMLHANYSSKHCWLNTRVGFATPEHLGIARRLYPEFTVQTEQNRKSEDAHMDRHEKLTKRILGSTIEATQEHLRGFLDMNAYRVEEK